MQIDKSEIKITSIKHDGFVIHFNYKEKHLFLQTGNMDREYELDTQLYERAEKGKSRLLGFKYGG